MKYIREFSLFSILALALISCSPPLPETYGVYAQTGRSLIRLSDEQQLIKVKPTVRFIIFDKMIGSGILGQGALPLEAVAGIDRVAYVRFEVERVRTRMGRDITEVRISPVERLAVLESDVPVNYSPIKNEPEMLQVIATEPLPEGLYSLGFNTQQFSFSVDINEDEIGENPHNLCQDEYSTSREPSKRFSWQDWISRTQGSGKTQSGNWIEKSGFQKCLILDEQAAQWRQDAAEAITEGQLNEAFFPTKLFSSYDPTSAKPLTLELETLLRAKAENEYRMENWSSVVALASLALDLSPDSKDLSTLIAAAEEEIKKSEEASRAAAAAARAKRLEEARRKTKSLGKIQVAKHEVFQKPEPGPFVEITDTGLVGVKKEGYRTVATGNPDDFVWYCNWPENPIGSLGGQILGLYKIRFADQSDWGFFEEKDRDRFLALVQKATAEWNERYRDVRDKYKCGRK